MRSTVQQPEDRWPLTTNTSSARYLTRRLFGFRNSNHHVWEVARCVDTSKSFVTMYLYLFGIRNNIALPIIKTSSGALETCDPSRCSG